MARRAPSAVGHRDAGRKAGARAWRGSMAATTGAQIASRVCSSPVFPLCFLGGFHERNHQATLRPLACANELRWRYSEEFPVPERQFPRRKLVDHDTLRREA